MSEARQGRGVPLPSFWQVLILVVGACAGWLVWSQMRPATPDPAPSPASAKLDKLQAIERIADTGPEAVPDLVEFLSDADASTRYNALLALGRVGAPAAEALDQIRERLGDEDPQVRMYAMTAFWRVCRDPEAAAHVAARLLADPAAAVREDAAGLLESIGPRATDAVCGVLTSEFAPARVLALQLLRLWEWDDENPEVPAAVRRLEEDPDAAVRPEALATIVICGRPTLLEIRQLMRQQAVVVCRNPRAAMFRAGTSPVGIALAEIGRRGPEGSELLPDVLALLRDEDQSTTLIWQVLPVLSAMNTAARPAGPRLRQLFETLQKVERLNQRDSSLRIAETMFDVGGDTDELVDLLIAALRNSESPARHDTARLLCRVSPASALEEAHRIISCLADDKAPVNVRDLFTLEGLAPFASEAVPLLIKLVDDPNKSVSGAAIRTLGEIGPKAAPAVSMFTAMLDVKPGYTRGPTDILVVNALGKIGPAAAPAVPALVNMLGAPDATIAADTLFGGSPHYGSAIAALKRIGDGNPAVLQALRLHFANKSPAVGAAAIDAFAQLDTDPDQVLSVLEQQLRVEDPAIRIAAIGALASRLADSKMVLTLLLQQLDHRDANLRARAILAISRLPGRVGVAIPALTSALSDENPYVRSAAALALGQIGPQAESAVPILKTMLHEPANWVRNSRYWPVGERYPVVSFYIPQLADISIRGAARSALAQIEE